MHSNAPHIYINQKEGGVIMTALSKEPMFLYPESRQFPFDGVCEQIVRALELRNWRVPGITVEFNVFGPSGAQYRMVRQITGDDFSFRLCFCRVQKNMGIYNYDAAVSQINIPKMEIDVDNDYSVPTFTKYVGEKWEKDKIVFFKSMKGWLSKIYYEPNMYLRYKVDSRIIGARSEMLIRADNDLGHKYSSEDKEPTEYKTDTVFQIFQLWLTDCVLAKILEYPVANEEIDIC